MWHRCIIGSPPGGGGIRINGVTGRFLSFDRDIMEGDFISRRNVLRSTGLKDLDTVYSRPFDAVELSDGSVFCVFGRRYDTLAGFTGHFMDEEFVADKFKAAGSPNYENYIANYPVRIIKINDSLLYSIGMGDSRKPVLYRWIIGNDGITVNKAGYIITSQVTSSTSFKPAMNRLTDGRFIYFYDIIETVDSVKYRRIYAVIFSVSDGGAIEREDPVPICELENEKSTYNLASYELSGDRFCVATNDGNMVMRLVVVRYVNGALEHGEAFSCDGTACYMKARDAYVISGSKFILFSPNYVYGASYHFAVTVNVSGLEVESACVTRLSSASFSTDSFCDIIRVGDEKWLRATGYSNGYYPVYYRVSIDADDKVSLEKTYEFKGCFYYYYNVWVFERFTDSMFFMLSPFDDRKISYAAIPLKDGAIRGETFVEKYNGTIHGVALGDYDSGYVDAVIAE